MSSGGAPELVSDAHGPVDGYRCATSHGLLTTHGHIDVFRAYLQNPTKFPAGRHGAKISTLAITCSRSYLAEENRALLRRDDFEGV